jgi:hypothetical protein
VSYAQEQRPASEHAPEGITGAADGLARKAVAMSMGDPFAGAEEEHQEPGQVAEEGFAGSAREVPHRAAMEKSFGVSFAGVQAYTDEHARGAADRLGAHAYASGNRIAFKSDNPDPSLVAHELTHVLQHTGGAPQRKAEADGIETAGEAEAEAVEAAVASGKPARGALAGGHAAEHDDHEHGHHEHGHGNKHGHKRERHGGGGAAGGGAALSRVRAPGAYGVARSKSDFGAGMSFNSGTFEKNQSYTLWDPKNEIRVPIGAVPGLSLVVDPSVKVKTGVGADFKKKALVANVGVDGEIGVGLGYGDPHVAELKSDMKAKAAGGFTYRRTRPDKGAQSWSLDGGFSFSTVFAIGVKLGGGVVEANFEFGQCNIGTLSHLNWTNGRFDPNQIGWAWGSGPTAFFDKIKWLIDKAGKLVKLGKDAAKQAVKGWKEVKDGVGKLGGVLKKIDLTPWDGLLPG